MHSHALSARLSHSHSHAHSHSHSPQKRHSSGSSTMALRPQSVQRLDQLSIDVEATRKHRSSDVRYVLRVHHRASRTQWSYSRSFDEYRAFQKRLLSVMRQGHICQAECPWLYSFVASYFPKSCVFSSSSSCVAQRQESLAKVLTQLHAFLLSRANHSCGVTHTVAEEFAKFVGTEMIDQIPVDKLTVTTTSRSSFESSPQRASSGSMLSTTSTDEESIDETLHCAICDQSIACPQSTTRHYTTVLGCGHEFHDECIVSKLNESMSCPVCGHEEH